MSIKLKILSSEDYVDEKFEKYLLEKFIPIVDKSCSQTGNRLRLECNKMS